MTQRSVPTRLPFARGWLLLVVAATAAVVAGIYDQRLKTFSHAGFLPANRNITIAARDLPYCWDTFEHLPTGQNLEPGLATYRQALERKVRLATGIRPTPARWSTWLGRWAIAAEAGGSWGLCVRPGLLLHGYARLTGRASRPSMIGEFHVAWKDGYLLASPDEGWVAAALANAAIDRGAIPARVDTIALTWATGRAQLRVAPDLPVNALLDLTPAPDSATRSQRLPQIGAPGQRPIFAMAAKDAATLSSLVDLVSGWLEISPTWARRMARIHEKLAEWRTSAEAITLRLERDGPLTVALNSVVRMDAATVPAFALVQQRQRASDAAHPLDALLPNALSLPGNWHGLEGQQTPLLGPALVLCTASDPEYWYAASSEPAMYALTRAAPQESSTPADATVHLDWPALTRNLTPLLRQAVKEGAYLPYNIEDFNRELQPLLQYFETLGSVELTLSNRTEGFEVAGYLDRHAEATP